MSVYKKEERWAMEGETGARQECSPEGQMLSDLALCVAPGAHGVEMSALNRCIRTSLWTL